MDDKDDGYDNVKTNDDMDNNDSPDYDINNNDDDNDKDEDDNDDWLINTNMIVNGMCMVCLLYTSDAADE